MVVLVLAYSVDLHLVIIGCLDGLGGGGDDAAGATAAGSGYNKKKDQFGRHEDLPDSLAMNALEKIVPRELETHLLLNHSRFKTFEEMEAEVVTFMEAKTGSKMTVSGNFSKAAANEAVPMDVDSLVKAVSGSLSSLVKGKGKGAGKARQLRQGGTQEERLLVEAAEHGPRKRGFNSSDGAQPEQEV